MEKILSNAKYMSGGGKPKFNDDYDFLLFRQDWNGTESIYFNKEELNRVVCEIKEGEIVVHMSYSVLFTKDEQLIAFTKDFPCYVTMWSD